jgi:TolB-like protein/Tfp pilus assembly protein PilF
MATAPEGRRAAAGPRFRFGIRSAAALAVAAAIGAAAGLAAAAPFFAPDLVFARTPTVMVLPITAPGEDRQASEMAANVTMRLTEGLSKIDRLRVLAPRIEATSSAPATQTSAQPPQADFVVGGELQMEGRSWTLKARLSNGATGEVRWASSISVATDDIDPSMQQSRLAAGLGHPLALRLNAMLNSGAARTAKDGELPSGSAKVVIEQAMASINQTTPERFRAAQAMLEQALAAEPENVDLEAALAAHWLRGIQMVWYNPVDIPAAKRNAQAALDRAAKIKPTYIPVLEGQCRFFTATNHFIESLVACGRVLSFDPWDGLALYNMGLSEMQLGRFDDALATFRQADQYNTPEVSRWTWLLGAGLTCALMDRNEEAVTYLTRSIAITPASGRSHAVLAGALQRLGRTGEARAAMAKAMELRPGSNVVNTILPTENASPVFLAALQHLLKSEVEAGLPER